ncbi:MAG: hypothetical protein KAR20_21755, partial [Candidatus Heimdallarchaeota archaeon]|nr:hypothetical protein [Candidatus Heimdallarchaeota archaeon]
MTILYRSKKRILLSLIVIVTLMMKSSLSESVISPIEQNSQIISPELPFPANPYFAQYDWNTTWGESWDDEAHAISVDSASCIYVAGYSGDADWDMSLVKFDPLGNQLWNYTFNGHYGTDQFFKDLYIDSSDDVYVVGGTEPVSALDSYITLHKFNSSGDLQWKNEIYGAGGNTFNQGNGVQVDSSGDIFVTGYTSSYGAGSYDVCLIKYNSTGDIQWSTTWGGM